MAAPAALPSLATPLDTLLLTSTSCVERVLLAQAVFAKGYSTTPAVAGKVWEEVKGALRGHALLRNREKEGGGWFEAEVRLPTFNAQEAGYLTQTRMGGAELQGDLRGNVQGSGV